MCRKRAISYDSASPVNYFRFIAIAVNMACRSDRLTPLRWKIHLPSGRYVMNNIQGTNLGQFLGRERDERVPLRTRLFVPQTNEIVSRSTGRWLDRIKALLAICLHGVQVAVLTASELRTSAFEEKQCQHNNRANNTDTVQVVAYYILLCRFR